MILNFLQTREPPVLPSLHMLPHKKKPPNAGVDISFADDIETLRGWGRDNKETLGELLFAFFKKYGHDLDYEKNVISVRAGNLLSKEEKGWQFLQNNRLCVEEPFNTGRNLGNTADDCSMRGIHLEFRRAHKILAEKGHLAECCEQYEFPPEEHHPAPPPPAPSRPVTLSRSNSNHGRNRNGYPPGSQRGGRSYHFNNRNGQNRRGSSGAAFNQNMMQPQYPEMFGYIPTTTRDQLAMIQAQIQAHAHAQAQLIHAAQIQAQMQQSQHQNGPSSAPSNHTGGSTPSHEAVNPFLAWPYIAHLYGLNPFYPNFGVNQTPNSDASSVPISPPRTPAAMVDGFVSRGNDANRLGLGRGGRRNGTYTNGSRSQSQPPPLYPVNGYSRSMPMAGVASSEDEDFGDHSSNGNPPETPPEEEPDEYVGYYTIGGSLQPDLAVVDPNTGDEEETFVQQKDFVDRQKRYSQERLPPPSLGGPTPIPASSQPVMSGGPYSTSNSSEAMFPFEHGVDGISDLKANVTAKLLEVHNNAQASPQHKSVGFPGSPAALSTSEGSISEAGETESVDSLGMSPNLRHRVAAPWNSTLKGRLSQEDLPLTALSPVPEAPTPSPTSTRNASAPKPAMEKEKPITNGAIKKKASNLKEDPVPPTPAPSSQRNGSGRPKSNGRSKANGTKPAPAKKKDGAEDNKETSNTTTVPSTGTTTKTSQWRTKPKKKRSTQSAPATAVVKDSERKGG